MRAKVSLGATVVLICLLAGAAWPATPPPAFTQLDDFPAAPAVLAFGIVGDTLGDGRFILYDGDTIWVETAARSARFDPLVSGYPGDPGFIAVSPDGHTALLGAGFSGDLYVLDTEAPKGAAAVANVGPHFWGVYLDETRVLLDRAVSTGPGPFDVQPELAVLDLSGTPVLRTVVANKGTYSAAVSVGPNRQFTYAADALTGETRSFAVADLIEAFDMDAPLEWSDGALIGFYNGGGPYAVSDAGTLLIGGFDPATFAGSVQFVDGASGEIAGEVNPTGNFSTGYYAVYNRVTGRVLIIGVDFPGPVTTGWVSNTPYEHQVLTRDPVWSIFLLFLLALLRRLLALLAL